MLKKWNNGAKGGEVRSIVDYNFNIVSKYLSKNIKALSTAERKSLSSDYLSENILVFDTDEKQWYKYSDGFWIRTFCGYDETNANAYTQDISTNDWIRNTIQIPFSQHGIRNPLVQLFKGHEGSFASVLGGVKIDSEYNVTLSTDLPFDGRVTIK